MPVTVPIIDQLIHPSIGLLSSAAVAGNPFAGPFIALAPPQSVLALTYGVRLAVHTVGASHGRDVSFPIIFTPPLGRMACLYTDISGLGHVIQVEEWVFDRQNYFWNEPLPGLWNLYLAPDVTVDLYWLQT